MIQKEADPVGRRVFRQRHGVEKGIEHTGFRGKERADAAHLGQLRPELALVPKSQAPAAVGLSLGQQPLQDGQVLLIEGQQQFAGFAIGDVKLAAQGFKALAACHTEPGHPAPRPVVEACVDHGGVAAAGPGGDVGFPFCNGHGQPEAAQLPGNGAAHSPSADDEDVIGQFVLLQGISPPLAP